MRRHQPRSRRRQRRRHRHRRHRPHHRHQLPTPLRLEGRILQIEQDLTGDQAATTITLGNITTGITRQDDAWRRQLDQLISNSGAWNDAATGTKPYITDLINRINQIMNTTGGYTYLKPGQGIYVYDKPEDQNPTQCIHIGGGYWRIANSKKANGDWDFRALADGNGIYANAIYTGRLSDAAGRSNGTSTPEHSPPGA